MGNAKTLAMIKDHIERRKNGRPAAPLPLRFRRSGPSLKGLLYEVARGMPGAFTVEDLIIAAWKAHPIEFGLRGHPEYPHSKVIESILYGRRGLIQAGVIVKRYDGRWEANETTTAPPPGLS